MNARARYVAESWRKENFSIAYMQTIATLAGFTVTRRATDIHSVDVQVEAGIKGQDCDVQQLDVQLKCTAKPSRTGDSLAFRMEARNIAHLSARSAVKRVLAVVVVPCERPEQWAESNTASLLLRCRAYWSIVPPLGRDAPPDNKVTVYLPLKQQLTPDELARMMRAIANGGDL